MLRIPFTLTQAVAVVAVVAVATSATATATGCGGATLFAVSDPDDQHLDQSYAGVYNCTAGNFVTQTVWNDAPWAEHSFTLANGTVVTYAREPESNGTLTFFQDNQLLSTIDVDGSPGAIACSSKQQACYGFEIANPGKPRRDKGRRQRVLSSRSVGPGYKHKKHNSLVKIDLSTGAVTPVIDMKKYDGYLTNSVAIDEDNSLYYVVLVDIDQVEDLGGAASDQYLVTVDLTSLKVLSSVSVSMYFGGPFVVGLNAGLLTLGSDKKCALAQVDAASGKQSCSWAPQGIYGFAYYFSAAISNVNGTERIVFTQVQPNAHLSLLTLRPGDKSLCCSFELEQNTTVASQAIHAISFMQ